jgi:uncharacterized protein YkwD
VLRRRLLPFALIVALAAAVVPAAADARAPRTPRKPRLAAGAKVNTVRRPTGNAASTLRPRSSAPSTASTPVLGNSGIESQILSLINSGRSGVGRGRLRTHGGLKSVARVHSRNMAARGGLTHAGFIGRLNAGARGWTSGCENVARYRGPSTNIAGIMYRLWINSPPHRRCMFDASNKGFNVAGVGVYRDSRGGWWATLELARLGR